MTEANTINNFNFGFSTYKSDILVHLSQWQYWWWFWFSIFWAMYFFVITRLIHKRTMQFNPIMNTSTRGHGKWGDFLVVIIPLSWCCNILINSNFILRMIEWQNESSLFTLRIQGKQWYWVYKFDATTAYNILTAPKNIGHNRWFVTVPGESYCADTYYQALHLGAQLEYKQLYLKFLADEKITKVHLENNTVNSIATELNVRQPVLADAAGIEKALQDSLTALQNINYLDDVTINELEAPAQDEVSTDSTMAHGNLSAEDSQKYAAEMQTARLSTKAATKAFLNNLTPTPTTPAFYDYPTLDDTSNVAANFVDTTNRRPLQFIRGVLNQHNLNLLQTEQGATKPVFFIAKFSNGNGALEQKTEDGEPLWGFKQKKYKRLQKFSFGNKVTYDPDSFAPIVANAQTSPFSLKSTIIAPLATDDLEADAFDYHRSIKYNRQRSELVPVNLARRLLRTKRTLVLPAHVNITVITNSYDVVHSWFIPGLGLKLDCVPGRSTHHTFYIDNVGFYYGQCAEICGRYHHHMPVRLCALPFEQFLVWWQKKGLKRLHRVSLLSNPKKFIHPNSVKFKYKW